MPQYKVTAVGFYDSVMYDPEGKRRVLHTDKPFPKKEGKEQLPSWLEAMKPETAAEKKKRGPEELAAHKEQVLVDLLDQIEVGDDDPLQIVLDLFEPIGNEVLHRRQVRRGASQNRTQSRFHHRATGFGMGINQG